MADRLHRAPSARDTTALDDPIPAPDDPGGAHAKGYSADPSGPGPVPAADPIPLAPGPDTHPAVHPPEREGKVQPTGRGENEPTGTLLTRD